MIRRLLTLTAAISFVIGCSRPKTGPAGGGGDNGAVESNPDAIYTLKLRPVQEGDKTDVIRYESMTTEVKRGAKTEHFQRESQFEYLEQIQEMPAGAALPTRLTRTYHTARRTDLKTGQLMP